MGSTNDGTSTNVEELKARKCPTLSLNDKLHHWETSKACVQFTHEIARNALRDQC